MNIGAFAVDDDCDDGCDDVADDDDDVNDDEDDIKADGGGVNEPLFTVADAAAAVAIGHGVVDIDACMVELRPFGFCCCFSFSGITIRLQIKSNISIRSSDNYWLLVSICFEYTLPGIMGRQFARTIIYLNCIIIQLE